MAGEKKIEWFGMKLTPQEKDKIRMLAKKKGVSLKEAVMSAVNEELIEYKVKPKPGSYLEKIEHIAGTADGPEDLSSNPDHLNDFGN
jgi:hypothetical protein